MRYNIRKKNSTKCERIIHELLKVSRIKFKHRWIIQGKEVDFLIKNIIIEIDGHRSDKKRDQFFRKLGYKIFHIDNSKIINKLESVKKFIYEITKPN